MNIEIKVGAGHQQIFVDGKATDLGVSVTRGYQIYKRADDARYTAPVADKVSHLLGKRIVMTPKHEGRITEADFLAEIAKAVG